MHCAARLVAVALLASTSTSSEAAKVDPLSAKSQAAVQLEAEAQGFNFQVANLTSISIARFLDKPFVPVDFTKYSTLTNVIDPQNVSSLQKTRDWFFHQMLAGRVGRHLDMNYAGMENGLFLGYFRPKNRTSMAPETMPYTLRMPGKSRPQEMFWSPYTYQQVDKECGADRKMADGSACRGETGKLLSANCATDARKATKDFATNCVDNNVRSYYTVDKVGVRKDWYRWRLYDPRVRPWYTEVKQAWEKKDAAGRRTALDETRRWSQVYTFSTSGALGITANDVLLTRDAKGSTQNCVTGCTMVGVAATDYELNVITMFLRNEFGGGKYGVVITEAMTGYIIASSKDDALLASKSKRAEVLKKVADKKIKGSQRLTMEEADDEVTRKIAKWIKAEFAGRYPDKAMLVYDGYFLQLRRFKSQDSLEGRPAGLDWRIHIIQMGNCKKGYFSLPHKDEKTEPKKAWFSSAKCTLCYDEFARCPGGKLGAAPLFPVPGFWFNKESETDDPYTNVFNQVKIPKAKFMLCGTGGGGNCIGQLTYEFVGRGVAWLDDIYANQKLLGGTSKQFDVVNKRRVKQRLPKLTCKFPTSSGLPVDYQKWDQAQVGHFTNGYCTCADLYEGVKVTRDDGTVEKTIGECCIEGHTGPMCGSCIAGFDKQSDGRCAQCSSTSIIVDTTKLILPLGLYVATAALLLFKTFKLNDTATFPIMIFFFQTVGLLAKASQNFGEKGGAMTLYLDGIMSSLDLNFEKAVAKCSLNLDIFGQFYLQSIVVPLLTILFLVLLRIVWNTLVVSGFVLKMLCVLNHNIPVMGETVNLGQMFGADSVPFATAEIVALHEEELSKELESPLHKIPLFGEYMRMQELVDLHMEQHRHHIMSAMQDDPNDTARHKQQSRVLPRLLIGKVEREKAFILLAIMFYAPITRNCMQMFLCRTLVGKERLLADLGQECWTWPDDNSDITYGGHVLASAIASVALFILFFGIPSFFVFRSRQFIAHNMCRAIIEQRVVNRKARASGSTVTDECLYRFKKRLPSDPYCDLYAFIRLKPCLYVRPANRPSFERVADADVTQSQTILVETNSAIGDSMMGLAALGGGIINKAKKLAWWFHINLVTIPIDYRLLTDVRDGPTKAEHAVSLGPVLSSAGYAYEDEDNEQQRTLILVEGAYFFYELEMNRKVVINLLYLIGNLYPDGSFSWYTWLIVYVGLSALGTAASRPYLNPMETPLRLVSDMGLIVFANVANVMTLSPGNSGFFWLLLGYCFVLLFYTGYVQFNTMQKGKKAAGIKRARMELIRRKFGIDLQGEELAKFVANWNRDHADFWVAIPNLDPVEVVPEENVLVEGYEMQRRSSTISRLFEEDVAAVTLGLKAKTIGGQVLQRMRLIKNAEVVEGLPKAVQLDLLMHFVEINYPAGYEIVRFGQNIEKLFIISAGSVSVFRGKPLDDHSNLVQHLHTGQCVGGECITSPGHSGAVANMTYVVEGSRLSAHVIELRDWQSVEGAGHGSGSSSPGGSHSRPTGPAPGEWTGHPAPAARSAPAQEAQAPVGNERGLRRRVTVLESKLQGRERLLADMADHVHELEAGHQQKMAAIRRGVATLQQQNVQLRQAQGLGGGGGGGRVGPGGGGGGGGKSRHVSRAAEDYV